MCDLSKRGHGAEDPGLVLKPVRRGLRGPKISSVRPTVRLSQSATIETILATSAACRLLIGTSSKHSMTITFRSSSGASRAWNSTCLSRRGQEATAALHLKWVALGFGTRLLTASRIKLVGYLDCILASLVGPRTVSLQSCHPWA